jgi:predicted nucleotide-binding protein
MAATFDRGRWIEISNLVGCESVIADHPRLLRVNNPEDQEYVDTVAQVVPALLGQKSYGGRVVELSNLAELEAYVGLEEWLVINDVGLHRELYGAGRTSAEREEAPTGGSTRIEPTDDGQSQTTLPHSSSTRRTVFLVHGRDSRTRDALAELLRAFDLKIIDWDEASRLTGVTTPYTGDVVAAGMDASDGVVVLMTPDDLARVRPEFRVESDGSGEWSPVGQPRMNVIFEAGMALARDRERVVIVQVGVLRTMSDIAGLNVVQLSDHVESRRQLGRRLRVAGLAVEMDHDRWRSAGTFSSVNETGPDFGPESDSFRP